jgi:UDP-glucose 4-epimerase
MRIMVTGGAGYVGSVVAEEVFKESHEVVVLDNLQQGHRAAIYPGIKLVITDICDPVALDKVFQENEIDAVIHMAAETVVEFSMTDPRRFFFNNIVGGLNLLESMMRNQVKKLVFSSSAAVYGEPKTTPIEENHPKVPVNSYGETKLMFERILEWYGRAYGLQHISFRYFNAAGASNNFGEDHRPETHLIPNVLKVPLNKTGAVSVFGSDYPTKDGSCIRDYVHVIDIAKAHILALQKIQLHSGKVFNLGSGSGYSVLEVIETSKKVTGVDIPTTICSKRAGDPAILLASSARAKTDLGWKPEFPELDGIIESAWKWMKSHPTGYGL